MLLLLYERLPGAREGLHPVAWAGVAAGVGAISREYGLYFIILGTGLLASSGRGRKVVAFLLPAACVAGPWYVRNWIRTGDPVFPALGAVFPTNRVHVEIMADIAHFMGFGGPAESIGMLPAVLAATSGAVWILGTAGAVRLRFRTQGILSAALLVIALWVWSMPQTAGGWNYSMRVLLPVMVLGSVLAGWIAGSGGRIRATAALLLAALSVDCARRAWLLPDDPLSTPWTLSFDEWQTFRAQDEMAQRRNIWPVLAKAAGSGYNLVDSPQPFVATIAAGGHPTPLVSPRAAPVFDPSISMDQAVRRLRSLNVRFVTFSVANPVVDKLVERHPVLRQLAHDYVPVANVKGLLIFDLAFLSRRQATSGSAQ
jgi:hypothetical protein